MLIKTKGIIIRSLKYKETSMILDIYTELFGKKSYIIGGVRKKKSKIGSGLVQNLTIVNLVAYHSPNNNLNRVKDLSIYYPYKEIPFNHLKGILGLFILEIVQKSIKEPEKNLQLFLFLIKIFKYLDQSDNSLKNLASFFMIKFCIFLGFSPYQIWSENKPYLDLQEGIYCSEKPIHLSLSSEQSKYVSDLSQITIEAEHLISLSREERKLVLQKLIDFYRFHLENFGIVKSLEIIHSILKY